MADLQVDVLRMSGASRKKHHLEELDFEKEASNLLRIGQGLSPHFPDVQVPQPVLELCSPTVLVMTRLEGHSLLDAIMEMAQAVAQMRGKTVDDLIAEFAQSSKDKDKDAPREMMRVVYKEE
eukprot:Skav201188  [mRNA]  locus=scaffold2736:306444:310953:+ [translate_table: standard]